MVQVWSPISQLQRSPEPGVWYIFDNSRRIAIGRLPSQGPVRWYGDPILGRRRSETAGADLRFFKHPETVLARPRRVSL